MLLCEKQESGVSHSVHEEGIPKELVPGKGRGQREQGSVGRDEAGGPGGGVLATRQGWCWEHLKVWRRQLCEVRVRLC